MLTTTTTTTTKMGKIARKTNPCEILAKAKFYYCTQHEHEDQGGVPESSSFKCLG